MTTPFTIGAETDAAGASTVVITTNANVAAGSTIVVLAHGVAQNPISIADSASNYYIQTQDFGATNTLRATTFYIVNCAALASGSTITITYSGSTGGKEALACAFTGVAYPGIDLVPLAVTGTGTAVYMSVPALPQPGEIAIASLDIYNGGGDTFTEDPNWTTLDSSTSNADAVRRAYILPNSIGALTYQPTLGTSRSWGGKIETYKITPSTIYQSSLILPISGTSAKPLTQFPTWGVTISDSGQVPLGLALGAQMQRVPCNNNQTSSGYPSTLCNTLRADGFSIELEVHNLIGSQNGPPTDAATYQSQIASVIQTCLVQGDTLNIENEVDGQAFYTGTAAQYLAQLALAAKVAHDYGYTIATDGTSTETFYLLYWQYLWNTGQVELADLFASYMLVPQQSASGINYAADLPSAQFPNLPILGNNPNKLTAMGIGGAIMGGAAQAGADYLNLHLYYWLADCSYLYGALQWAQNSFGLQVTCNEVGWRDSSTTTALMPNHMGVCADLGMPYHIWATSQSLPHAQPLGDATGVLNSGGTAWKTFAANNRS